MGACKNYVGKIFGRKLSIHLNPKTFWKKLLFQEIYIKKFRIQTSKRKWNKLTGSSVEPKQWSHSNSKFHVCFTLSKSKIFCRSHSVANWHQNYISGFQTVITFNVQMFSNPTAKFKTAKSSLQTAEVPLFFKTTSKTVVVYIHYQLNIWCTKQSELENKISSNKMKSSLSQSSFRNLFRRN